MRIPNIVAALAMAAASLRGDKRDLEARKAAALKAIAAGRLEEALAQFEAARDHWPFEPSVHCGAIACNRALQRYDHAQQLVERALERFPNNSSVIAEAAALAQSRFDWPRALEFWEKIIHRRDCGAIYLETYALAAFVLGRDDRLEEALRLIRKRFPDSPAAFSTEAQLAMRREQWDRALTLWREYSRLRPGDAYGWEHSGLAEHNLALERAEQNDSRHEIAAPVHIDVVENEDARTLLLSFESLGHNCELGLVQRRFGAEPLGLLRFNRVEIGGLIEAAANRFDGMGAPGRTALTTHPNGEYFIEDRRWGLAMHTFIYKWSEDAERLHPKLCRRVAFLKDKLLADLAEGRKTFVFSSSTLRFEQLLMLHSALASCGDVALLHVRPIGAPSAGFPRGEAGRVIEARPRLFVGYLSRPGSNARGEWNVPFDEWLDICRATARLRGAAALAEPAAALGASA
ncbi:lipopolysaccharide assembly protein LapB [Methylosinus sp. Sm6]|uniref:tetratricopeptide repeat protein n=1 Tax=Methylosinus sp. Sm6 TaxID=2866948 RepID=UPI001C98F09C|nr:hypothetical protein [Methylosinus sp. Sm6]MBY6241821.1 hypothetical protein [Methylosinus sp. Sm6]